MIELIIITEDEFYKTKYKILIEKIMMNYDLDYQITITNSIPTKNNNLQIYLIELGKEKKEIEYLNRIRYNNDDWQSMIIIISDYEEYKYEVLNSDYLLISYIERNYYSESRLKKAINIALKNYYQRPKCISYSYKKVIYNINYQQILWIEKDQNTKRCLIKTPTKEYFIQATIKDIYKTLDNYFIKCSKSCIINMQKVETYDYKNNIITFEGGISFYNISLKNKKKIKDFFLKSI